MNLIITESKWSYREDVSLKAIELVNTDVAISYQVRLTHALMQVYRVVIMHHRRLKSMFIHQHFCQSCLLI